MPLYNCRCSRQLGGSFNGRSTLLKTKEFGNQWILVHRTMHALDFALVDNFLVSTASLDDDVVQLRDDRGVEEEVVLVLRLQMHQPEE